MWVCVLLATCCTLIALTSDMTAVTACVCMPPFGCRASSSYEDAVALAQAADIVVLMLGIDGKVRKWAMVEHSNICTTVHRWLDVLGVAHALQALWRARPAIARPSTCPLFSTGWRPPLWLALVQGSPLSWFLCTWIAGGSPARAGPLHVCWLRCCDLLVSVLSVVYRGSVLAAVATLGCVGCRNGGCLDVSAEKATVGAMLEAGYPGNVMLARACDCARLPAESFTVA